MKKLFIISIVSVFTLSACGVKASEKERYINAVSETSCTALNADILDQNVAQKNYDIFESYGFDWDDEELKTSLDEKYAKDKELIDAVNTAIENCGGELFGSIDESPVDKSNEDKSNEDKSNEDKSNEDISTKIE